MNKVIRNFSFLTLSSFLNQIIGLFIVWRLGNYFTPNTFGLFSYFLVQCGLLITVADFGLRNVVIRRVARNPMDAVHIFKIALQIKLGFSLVVSGSYILYNYLLGGFDLNTILVLILVVISNCVSNLFESVLWGLEKMMLTAIINIISSLLWLCFVLWYIGTGDMDIEGLIIGYAIAMGLKLILYFLFHHNFITLKESQISFERKQIIRESLPFFALVLVMVPLNFLSFNLLDYNSTDHEMGVFSLSHKLLAPVSVLSNLLMSALLPGLSFLFQENKVAFRKKISVGYLNYTLIITLVCLTINLFVKDVFLLIFPSSYLDSVESMRWLVWYFMFGALNTYVGTVLSSSDREKEVLKSGIWTACISLPVIYYFSFMGAKGLSLGFAVSILLSHAYVFKKYIELVQHHIMNYLFLYITLIGLSCFTQFVMNDKNLSLRITFIGISILIVLYVLRIVNARQLKLGSSK
jgi:O-antigen/teichoic acid export membrane protein